MVSRMTLLLGFGLTCAGLGCVSNPSLPVAPPPPKVQPTTPVVTKEILKTKRTPKATTFVAWGEMREHDAEEKGLDTSRQMELCDEARQVYQQALKIDPKCLPAYTGLARVYMKLNHYDRALEMYNQAAEKYPKDFSLWFDMGICHCRVKHWDLAVFSFKRALEMDPENRAATQTLGFCLARAGRLQESLETLQKLMSPAQAHYQISRMLHHVQRDDLCREELRLALQLEPDLAPARNLLASLDGPPNTAPTPPAAGSQVQLLFEE
jgi:tetratricopeptide (TPR) repeat protein